MCATERYTKHDQEVPRNKTLNPLTFFTQTSTLLLWRYDFLSALRLLGLNFVSPCR